MSDAPPCDVCLSVPPPGDEGQVTAESVVCSACLTKAGA
jgi:hypothetical protein